MNLLRKAARMFKPKNDLSKTYAASMLPGEALGLAPYPKKDFLAAQGIYAYRLQFMVLEHDAKAVLSAIAANFKVERDDIFQEGSARNDQGYAIHFSIRPEFDGAVVELVTNFIPFLKALDAMAIKPPAPWVVFPEIDPESLGSLQGSIDYWWTWFWSPFWDAVSDDEKARF